MAEVDINKASVKDKASPDEEAIGSDSKIAPMRIMNAKPKTKILGGEDRNRTIFSLLVGFIAYFLLECHSFYYSVPPNDMTVLTLKIYRMSYNEE
ncbi:hypothetical protein D3C76_987230 [compost metagenome]